MSESASPTATPTATPPATPAPTPSATPPSVEEQFKGLLAKQEGDAAKLARELFAENHKLRERNRTLKATAAPKDGVVLTKEQAAEFTAYQALGKAADLKTALDEGTQSKDALQKASKATLHSQAASAHGYKASVLTRLLDTDGVSLEVRDGKLPNGQPTKVAYVKHKAADGKEAESPLPDYAKQQWPDFLPSLTNKPTPEATVYRNGQIPAPGHGGNPPVHNETNGRPNRLHEGATVF